MGEAVSEILVEDEGDMPAQSGGRCVVFSGATDLNDIFLGVTTTDHSWRSIRMWP
jgi:hypothetical protein